MKNVLSKGFFFLFIIAAVFVGGSSIAFADNHAPVLDVSKSPIMNAVNEDSGAPSGAVGTNVSNLIDSTLPAGGLDNVTDSDGPTPIGIAIIGTDSSSLTCYYSTNSGSTWTPIGAVSNTSARLLAANSTNRVYCQGAPNNSGTFPAAFIIRAWDQSTGVDGGLADASVNGGTTAFSSASDTVALIINPVNDAPVLDASRSPALNDVVSTTSAPVGVVGTLVSSLVDFAAPAGQEDNVTDVDSASLLGIAITAQNDGLVCYYTVDSGTTWHPFTGVGGSEARLLAANATNRVYCNSATAGNYADALTIRAWDQTTGTDGSFPSVSSTGGTTAFSSVSDTVSLSITSDNHAPVLDAAASPTMINGTEDDGAPSGAVGTPVTSLIDLASSPGGLDNTDDIDSGPVTGVAITATDSYLTCYYSINSGTEWSAIGSVSDTSARLLAASSTNRIYCHADPNTNGSFDTAVTFRAWDQTSGTNGGLANASIAGGSSAYSVTTDSASFTITAVNDAPSATNLSAAETYTQNHALNLIDIVPDDVDNSSVTVTLTLSNPSAGTLNTTSVGPYTSTYNASTGVWSVTGAIPYVISILQGLTFTPALNVHSSFTIATLVSDGSLSVSGSKAVTGSLDTTAPTVVSVSPTNVATNVLVDSHVVITFSERMNTASFAASTTPCNLGEGSNTCATYTPVWSAGNTVVTLTLGNGPFATGVNYTVNIGAAADLAGNNLGDYSWSFTTIAPYVLTEVTPIPSIVDSDTAYYYFSSSGTGTAEVLMTECGGDAEVSVTEIGALDQHVRIRNLQPGQTYDCSMQIQSVVGTDQIAHSNTLHIGPFNRLTVITNTAGGGMSSFMYGCTDPQATNYQPHVISDPRLCEYRAGSSRITVATTSAFSVAISTTTAISSTTTTNIALMTGNSSRFIFTKNLRAGMTDGDVLELQRFLNTHGFVIATTGSGSVGNETNYFGPKTKIAVKKFQEAHAAVILMPQQLTQGTGIFGKGTRDFVNGL